MFSKKIKLEDIKSVLLNPNMILNVNGINEDKILEKENGQIILHFIKTVKQNFNEEDLILLRNNFYNLNIIWQQDSNQKAGCYNLYQESIVVPKNNPSEIYRALFYAASTYMNFNNNCIFSGFSQEDNKGRKIGVGINKGYTEYLSRRYFLDEKCNNSFMYEMNVAKIIEHIIGKDIMQSLYLNASLEGLIWELNIEPKKTYEFLTSLDSISKELDRKNARRKIIDAYSTIVNDFLVEAYVSKGIEEGKDSNDLRTNIFDEVVSLQQKLYENKKDIGMVDSNKILTSVDNYIDLYKKSTYSYVKTK